jgi:hypothetical protein
LIELWGNPSLSVKVRKAGCPSSTGSTEAGLAKHRKLITNSMQNRDMKIALILAIVKNPWF